MAFWVRGRSSIIIRHGTPRPLFLHANCPDGCAYIHKPHRRWLQEQLAKADKDWPQLSWAGIAYQLPRRFSLVGEFYLLFSTNLSFFLFFFDFQCRIFCRFRFVAWAHVVLLTHYLCTRYHDTEPGE